MSINKFEKGKIYHIFNRGVEKRDIFINDADKWRFLQAMFLFNNQNALSDTFFLLEREKGVMNFRILKDFINNSNANRKPLVRIMADCLMPNHYHFLMEEIEEKGISRFMQRFGTGYTKYFNKKHDRVGGLFQGPFKSVLVDEDNYLQYLLVYINVVNPGQLLEPELKEVGVNDIEKIMKFAEEYYWGTHREYLGKRESIIIDKGIFKDFFPDPIKYRDFAKDILLGKNIIQ
jgi:putative transposase